MIYILHFDRPLAHAQHYIGFVEDPACLEKRVKEHRSGSSKASPLVTAALAAGIDFVVATTMEGTRVDERNLKNQRKVKRFCPLCREGWLEHQRARYKARMGVVRTN